MKFVSVPPEYSVDPMSYDSATSYLMAGMDPQHPAYPLGDGVTTWYSCSPQGPWSHQTTEYTAPQAGANGRKTGMLVTYHAKAHTEFTDGDGVLMSCNGTRTRDRIWCARTTTNRGSCECRFPA
jgi:hypothetical protein